MSRAATAARELAELRATMALLNTWEGPEPNPISSPVLKPAAEERQAGRPVGCSAARSLCGWRRVLLTAAAMALTVMMLLGGAPTRRHRLGPGAAAGTNRRGHDCRPWTTTPNCSSVGIALQ